MKKYQALRSLGLATFCLILLAGFTGREKFIELEGYLNGRSTSAFRKQDKNILAVLQKGTRGEILESKKMNSGNYGILVKVLSGPQVGKSYWVYYNVKNPDLALYDTPPENWGLERKAASVVEEAVAAEVVRDTPAIVEEPVALSYSPQEEVASDNADYSDAFKAIMEGNEALKYTGVVPAARPQDVCLDCYKVGTPVSTKKMSLTSQGRAMAPRCSMLVNKSGELGQLGKSVKAIMSESRYKALYTKSNALGSFCPRFNKLNEEQKLQAWTWFWTALATEESQCITDIRHATTYRDRSGRVRTLNPREGYGLWAMEKDANIRRSRGAACRDISSGAGQARCSIDIMAKTQLSLGRSASGYSGSYWGPVRRGASQLMPHMRRLSVCF